MATLPAGPGVVYVSGGGDHGHVDLGDDWDLPGEFAFAADVASLHSHQILSVLLQLGDVAGVLVAAILVPGHKSVII